MDMFVVDLTGKISQEEKKYERTGGFKKVFGIVGIG